MSALQHAADHRRPYQSSVYGMRGALCCVVLSLLTFRRSLAAMSRQRCGAAVGLKQPPRPELEAGMCISQSARESQHGVFVHDMEALSMAHLGYIISEQFCPSAKELGAKVPGFYKSCRAYIWVGRACLYFPVFALFEQKKSRWLPGLI